MYRNMQKVDKILYNLDCLICDNNKSLRDLIYINEELTLVLEKENERINATSIVKNKYVEDGTDAFYFIDAFQEIMFDAYFLKE